MKAVTLLILCCLLLCGCTWQPTGPKPAPAELKTIIISTADGDVTIRALGCSWDTYYRTTPPEFLWCYAAQDYTWLVNQDKWEASNYELSSMVFSGYAKSWRVVLP